MQRIFEQQDHGAGQWLSMISHIELVNSHWTLCVYLQVAICFAVYGISCLQKFVCCQLLHWERIVSLLEAKSFGQDMCLIRLSGCLEHKRPHANCDEVGLAHRVVKEGLYLCRNDIDIDVLHVVHNVCQQSWAVCRLDHNLSVCFLRVFLHSDGRLDFSPAYSVPL